MYKTKTSLLTLETSMYYSYVLQHSDGRFYIGASTLPKNLLVEQHKDKKISNPWLGKYPMFSFYRKEYGDHVRNWTIELMQKHGIRKVRNSVYSTLILPKHQEKTLRDELNNFQCWYCKGSHHGWDSCERRFIDSKENSEDETCIPENCAAVTGLLKA